MNGLLRSCAVEEAAVDDVRSEARELWVTNLNAVMQ